MPVTPYHFGPGLALKGLLGQRMSFGAFVAANIVIDVEPLYFLLTHQPPVHRFMHTIVGATLGAAAVVAVWAVMRRVVHAIAKRAATSQPNDAVDLTTLDAAPPFGVRIVAPMGATIVGAMLGAYSHLFFDALMHPDAELFWPISQARPLLGLVSVSVIHDFCMWMLGLGVTLLALRWKTTKEIAAKTKDESPMHD